MSLENAKQIDAIGIDKQSGQVILSIIDDVIWDDEITHLVLLQEKINSYLRFIENGKLFTAYPEAVGRRIALKIFLSYSLTTKENEFLAEATKIIGQAGYQLSYKVVVLE